MQAGLSAQMERSRANQAMLQAEIGKAQAVGNKEAARCH